MGNASGKQGHDAAAGGIGGSNGYYDKHADHSSPPPTSHSPLIISPQTQNEPPVLDPNESSEKYIPTMITWAYGGNTVSVEGSWDNWTSRKLLQRSGKDHSILLVIPSGIYHFKFIVDGEGRFSPDLPSVADEMGNVCNLLDVNDYVPENLYSVAEFELPTSPDTSYNQTYPPDEDYAKEPVIVPPQLHLTVVGEQKHIEQFVPSSEKPQHVMLNHLYIEKGWAPQSVVALGLTHRYQSKYVTVVLYKPLMK